MDSIQNRLTNLQRLHDNIKFADAKAGLLVVPNTAILWFVFCEYRKGDLESWAHTSALLAALFALFGIYFCYSVIKPRGHKIMRPRGSGVVCAARIQELLKRKKESTRFNEEARKDFEIWNCSETVEDESRTKLVQQMDELAIDYAKIDEEKYTETEKAINSLILSGMLSLLFAICLLVK